MLEFTKRTGLSVFEASAKSGNGVESSFIALTDALIEINQSRVSEASNSTKTTQPSGAENPYEQPFDENKIKMKRI